MIGLIYGMDEICRELFWLIYVVFGSNVVKMLGFSVMFIDFMGLNIGNCIYFGVEGIIFVFF